MQTHPHEIEEQDFWGGPVLWDADPDVCCAAFQLGACHHTEAYWDDEDMTDVQEAELQAQTAVAVAGVDDPF